MKSENESNDKNKKEKDIKIKEKNKVNNVKSDINNENNNNNKNLNTDDPGFDLSTFCPDPDSIDKKTRSRTVRESVKKGKLKKLMDEQKPNAIDPRKFLKTPQVMVPKLRPKKSSLNPTPLKLNPFSKSSKLNLISEENIILSEHEEESENSESSSSSSSFLSSEDDNNNSKDENIVEEEAQEEEEKEEEKEEKEEKKEKEEKEEEDDEEEEEEEDDEEEKEEKEEKEKKEIKEEKEKDKDKDKGKEDKTFMGILRCIMKGNKIEDIKKDDAKNNEKNKKDYPIIEDVKEEIGQTSLMEFRKNMKIERKSFKKKNKDAFNLIDFNIKNNYKKFKENVLDEEKNNEDDIYNNKNVIDIKNTQKCCPILDFYKKKMSLLKLKI